MFHEFFLKLKLKLIHLSFLWCVFDIRTSEITRIYMSKKDTAVLFACNNSILDKHSYSQSEHTLIRWKKIITRTCTYDCISKCSFRIKLLRPAKCHFDYVTPTN